MRLGLTFFWLLACAPAACRPQGLPSSSATAGFGAVAAEAAAAIPVRTAEELAKIQGHLEARIAAHSVAAGPAILKPAVAQSHTAAALTEVISSGDTLPREQAADLLRAVVNGAPSACGGVSCQRAMGISAADVDDFLDSILFAGWSAPKSTDPQASATLKTVMACLTPKPKLGRATSFGDVLRSISQLGPSKLPKADIQPKAIPTREDFAERLDLVFFLAVSEYTGAEYASYRQVETAADADLCRIGYTPRRLSRIRRNLQALETGLAKMPKVSTPIYRGVRDMRGDDLVRLFEKWRTKTPIGLGLHDFPGLTSASWSQNVAMDFALPFDDGFMVHSYGVVYEIEDSGGVAVEAISNVPNEHEVLIPSGRTFQIEDIHLLSSPYHIFHVKLRGLGHSAQVRWQVDPESLSLAA